MDAGVKALAQTFGFCAALGTLCWPDAVGSGSGSRALKQGDTHAISRLATLRSVLPFLMSATAFFFTGLS